MKTCDQEVGTGTLSENRVPKNRHNNRHFHTWDVILIKPRNTGQTHAQINTVHKKNSIVEIDLLG